MDSREPREDEADAGLDSRQVQLLWALDEQLIAKRRPQPAAGTNGKSASDTLGTAGSLTIDLDPQTAAALDSDRAAIELLAWAGPALARARLHAADQLGGTTGVPPIGAEIGEHDAPLPERLGRFEVVRELGRGGLGIVLLARDPVLRRDVALKIPRPEALFTPDLRARFAREAQAAARLTHPNLVSVYEVGEAGAVVFIAAVYCDGPNLSDWLAERGGRASPKTAAEIVAQLADGIEYAHSQGVLHRDLKPSNVVLAPRAATASEPNSSGNESNGELPFVPKITDFGLARIEDLAGAATRSGLVMGTPSYMAPEQAEGRVSEIGRGTDVYGLGAILYELLSGQPPFRGQSDADTLRRVIVEEPPGLRRMAPAVPRDLEAICIKCLEKSPARRYKTAAQLASDLRRFCAGEPTKARPVGAIGTFGRWARRKPLAAILAGVVMASIGIVLALSATYVARLQDARDTADAERVRAESVAGDNAVYRYALQMRRGFELQSAGNAAGAKKVLDEFRPPSEYADLRGFEWYYLNHLLRDAPKTLVGHRGHVNAVVFSPDGRQLLSGGDDGTVRGWDPATGQELFCREAHHSCVNALSFSADGRLLATGSCDCTIRVWDTIDWRLLTTLAGHPNRVETVAFSPTDNTCLASCGCDPVLRLWDVSRGQLVRSLDTERGWLISLAWMADGKTVFAVGGDTMQRNGLRGRRLPLVAWDIEKNTATDAGLPEAFDSAACTIAVALDAGDTVIGVGGAQNYLGQREPFAQYVRRGKSKDVVVPLAGHVDTVHAVAISPDARLLASGGCDTSVRVCNTWSGACEHALNGHADRVSSLAFAPHDSFLASASFDGTVKLWGSVGVTRAGRRTIPARFRDKYGIDLASEFAVSADCRFFAMRPTREQVNVIDLDENNRCVATIDVPADARLAFSFSREKEGNNLNIASQSGKGIRWNFREGGREDGTLDALLSESRDGDIENPHRLTLSPSGQVLFDVDVPRISMIDTRNGETLREFPNRRDWSGTVCLTPDGQMAAVHVSDESWLLDLASGAQHSFVESTCIANGASKVAQAHSFTLNVFDPARPDDVLTLHHSSTVFEAAFSPDARTLATYTSANEIYLWNVATGEQLAKWAAPPGRVFGLRFSDDGRRLCAVTVAIQRVRGEEDTREEDIYAVVWCGDEGP